MPSRPSFPTRRSRREPASAQPDTVTRAAEPTPLLSPRAALARIAPALERMGLARERPTSPPADPQPGRRAALRGGHVAPPVSRPLLVVSDFDGTLAPLVMDPWGARMLPTAQRALRRLAGRPDVAVALISGRTAQDLCGRARVGGALYLGNHGLEAGWLHRGSRPSGLHPASRADLDGFVEVADQLTERVVALVPEPWLIVERKGPAVTFHYRQAPDVPRAGRRVQEAVDRIDHDRRFERLPGRRMLELRPPGAPSKEGTMAEVVAALRPGVAIMLGDDISDAQAFVALRRAAAGSSGRSEALSLAVRARVEPLPQVEARADAVLGSPADAGAFLAALAATVAAREPEEGLSDGFDWAEGHLGDWISGERKRRPEPSG